MTWRRFRRRVPPIALLAGVVAFTSPVRLAGIAADFGPLRNASRDLILGFDLQDDLKPSAVVLLQTPSQAPAMSSFVVPCKLQGEVESRPELFLTWGPFDTKSLFTFISTPDNAGSYQLTLTPALSEAREDFPDVSRFRPGVYLLRNGLDRYFVVNAEPTAAERQAAAALVGRRELDGIAVALPHGSMGIEIEGGQTSRPLATETHEDIRFFAPGGVAPARLELRYRVRPTSLQKLILKWGLKVVGVLLVPLLSLVFLQGADLKRPAVRWFGIVFFALLQVAICVLYFVVVRRVPEAATEDPLADFFVVATGAAAQLVILWAKAPKQ